MKQVLFLAIVAVLPLELSHAGDVHAEIKSALKLPEITRQEIERSGNHIRDFEEEANQESSYDIKKDGPLATFESEAEEKEYVKSETSVEGPRWLQGWIKKMEAIEHATGIAYLVVYQNQSTGEKIRVRSSIYDTEALLNLFTWAPQGHKIVKLYVNGHHNAGYGGYFYAKPTIWDDEANEPIQLPVACLQVQSYYLQDVETGYANTCGVLSKHVEEIQESFDPQAKIRFVACNTNFGIAAYFRKLFPENPNIYGTNSAIAAPPGRFYPVIPDRFY
ncbi:MAG: hypothetical protein KDD25_04540 [Bdellovibrionales bacterium]|nr:hypothetical protein [Bdellovibrionales bacterium]